MKRLSDEEKARLQVKIEQERTNRTHRIIKDEKPKSSCLLRFIGVVIGALLLNLIAFWLAIRFSSILIAIAIMNAVIIAAGAVLSYYLAKKLDNRDKKIEYTVFLVIVIPFVFDLIFYVFFVVFSLLIGGIGA